MRVKRGGEKTRAVFQPPRVRARAKRFFCVACVVAAPFEGFEEYKCTAPQPKASPPGPAARDPPNTPALSSPLRIARKGAKKGMKGASTAKAEPEKTTAQLCGCAATQHNKNLSARTTPTLPLPCRAQHQQHHHSTPPWFSHKTQNAAGVCVA